MKVFINNKQIDAKIWIFDKDGTLVLLDGWGKIMKKRLELIENRYGKEARERTEPILGYRNGKFDIKYILYTTRQETSTECAKALGTDVKEVLALFEEADKLLKDNVFKPVNGAKDLLAQLIKGRRVIILTNDLEERTRRILNNFQIPFHRVIGSDTYPYHKPDPRLISAILEEEGLSTPQKVVVIGDSRHEIELAKNSGAISVGVLTGLEDEEGLKDADFILKSINEIHIKEG